MELKPKQRLLKYSRSFILGDNCATLGHLIIFLGMHATRADINVVANDLNPRDKMNCGSLERLSSESLRQKLLEEMPGCKLTAAILELISRLDRAHTKSKNVRALERRENLICCWAFLRHWRAWLNIMSSKANRSIDIQQRFVSSNTRSCVMLSVASSSMSLMEIALGKECEGDLEKMKPFLLGVADSQGCESLFCALRSLSGVLASEATFNLLGFLRKVRHASLAMKWLRELPLHGPEMPKRHKLRKRFHAPRLSPDTLSDCKEVTLDSIREAGLKGQSEALARLQDLGLDADDNEITKIISEESSLSRSSAEAEESASEADEGCEQDVVSSGESRRAAEELGKIFEKNISDSEDDFEFDIDGFARGEGDTEAAPLDEFRDDSARNDIELPLPLSSVRLRDEICGKDPINTAAEVINIDRSSDNECRDWKKGAWAKNFLAVWRRKLRHIKHAWARSSALFSPSLRCA